MNLDETSEGIDFSLLNYVKESREYITMLESQIQRLESLTEKSDGYIKSLEAYINLLEKRLNRPKGFWRRWLMR